MQTHAHAPSSPVSGELGIAVEFCGITKQFARIAALTDVSFAGEAGTVHAITGENGAGKSTLMKMLAGAHAADAGEILLGGRPLLVANPAEARSAGVATVFQEATLLPNLTVAENLFLGREPRRNGLIDRGAMRRQAEDILEKIGVDLNVNVACGDLAVSEQYLVEIAKATAQDARVVIYDEPTAALDAQGVEKLFRLIDEQKRSGKLIFYISHRMGEIFDICDTTTVLKDGRHVRTCRTAELTRDGLVALMVGREIGHLYPPRKPRPAEAPVALSVDDFAPIRGGPAVSFSVYRGEIVGLAGLEGQGQRDIVRALAGIAASPAGEARKHDRQGRQTRLRPSVVAVVKAGVGFIPEDRKSEGLYLSLSIERNIGLGMLRRAPLASRAQIDKERIRQLMRAMNVRARDARQVVSALSGGNQQKVMIGRWLAAGIDVLLVEEPTRGVDVGAKAEIYRLLREFADQGGAVLLTSTELTEHLGLCDRILVVRGGEIVAQLPAASATEEMVMRYALLGRPQEGPVQ
jgi:ribose transport system ATP-binding protein